MPFPKSKQTLLAATLAAFLLLVLAPLVTGAQEITYYDFGAAGSTPTASCSPTAPVPFCQNAGGTSTAPTFVLDTYPPAIDPNSATDGNTGSNVEYYTSQLTANIGAQSNAMWYAIPQKVTGGFDVYFVFKIIPPSGDGLAFVIQNAQGGGAITVPFGGSTVTCTEQGSALTAVNGSNTQGGCLGYSGVDNSIALEFDTYPDTSWGDPDGNHIALQSCGISSETNAGLPNSPSHLNVPGVPNPQGAADIGCTVSLSVSGTPTYTWPNYPYALFSPSSSFSDGNYHQVVIVYNGPNDTPANYLYVYLDPPFNPGTYTPASTAVPVFQGPFDITQFMSPFINSGTAGNPSYDSAYVGFTAGNGGSSAAQEIMAWTFTPHTTVTQTQPLQTQSSTNPTYQQFNFGTHTYGVEYPPTSSGGPSTSGFNMTLTATTISPTAFAALIAGTPFAGSSCQVYDNTGGNSQVNGEGNCVIYSVSCTDSNNNPVACPAASVANCVGSNAADCINVKTVFDSSSTPTNPGFLQGDPFLSAISSISGDGTAITVTCTGECSVTPNQQVSITGLIGGPACAWAGSYQVSSSPAPTINQFTAASTQTTGSVTGCYLTSSNVQNIFTGYTTANIDGTSTGKTNDFSDFVFLSNMVAPGTTTTLGATNNNPTESASDPLTATVTASIAQFGAPSGTVTFSTGLPVTDSNTLCGGSMTLVPSATTPPALPAATTTCDYTAPGTPGSVTIYATYNADLNHASSSSSPLSLNVSAITPTVTFSPDPSSQTYGPGIAAGTLDATATVNNVVLPSTDGGITYTAAPTGGGASQPIGVGTILSAGSYTLTASFASTSSSYNSQSATAPYIVSAATPTIAWGNPAAITYGTGLAGILSATATFNSNAVSGNFSYTAQPAAGGPAVPVTAATILTAGRYTLSVTFSPTSSNFTAPPATTVPLTVNQAPVTLSWATPAAIPYGTPLTSTQLNAAVSSPANLPGTFSYTPGVGTVLPTANAQTLSVTFTPLDKVDYTTVSTSVAINVTAAGFASISPSSINFGTLYLGSIVTKTVTVSNTGSAALTISDPLIAIVPGVNGSLSEFVTINLCPKTLAVGKSCIMTVTFIGGPFYTPQDATLSISDSSYGSPQTVPLTATVIDPVAQFSATSLSFGTEKSGTGSSKKSITLTSAGGTSLSVTSIAISGDPKDFTETDNCIGTFNPKATCTISVTFAPSAKGSHTATLVVTDNAANSPQSISLSGTGD
jgi:hypothetical protein